MASPELQAVLSNAAHFEMLVAQLLVPDNAARQQAEALFQQSKEHADACVSHLTQILRTSAKDEHKSFCAVMLRKVRRIDRRRRARARPPRDSLRPLIAPLSPARAPQVLTKEDPPVWTKASPNVQVRAPLRPARRVRLWAGAALPPPAPSCACAASPAAAA
jgi:hypothetical protein